MDITAGIPRQLQLAHRRAPWGGVLVVLVGILTHWTTLTAEGAPTIVAASGYGIAWDGNEGANLNGPVPDNIALAANGSTAFAESEYGNPHFTTCLNNGTYGNNNGWLRNIGVVYPGTPAESWFGIDLPGTSRYNLTQIALGRDNVTSPYTDRWSALFTLQFTTDTTIHTGNGGNWTTIGTIDYGTSSSGWSPWLRHAFTIATSGGDPIAATGFRVLIDNYNDGSQVIVDEFEITGTMAAGVTAVNNTGTTDITLTGAKLRGQLVSEAATPTTCRFEWWARGSVTTNVVDMGTRAVGEAFTNALGSLTAATTYYYRTSASNSAGVVYAPAVSFRTLTHFTVAHEYLFEEGSAGNQVSETADSVGSSTMTRQAGNPRFSATAPTQGSASAISADFANAGRLDTASGALWGTATDNFGMEAWVRPASATGNQSILVNGYNTGVQGIYQVGGEYQIMLDGILYDFNAAITGIGTWDHVAMVRDQGVATLYVNGVAAGSTAAAVSGTPNIHAFIGAASPGFTTGGGDFVGMVDTIRYFTFAGGTFLGSDLDYPMLPATVANNNGGATDITLTGAKLRGQLVSEAAAPTTCRFEWWARGSATTNVVNMGTRATGEAFTNALGSLTAATTYYYRTTASNSSGVAYAPTASFRTLTHFTVTHEYLFEEGSAGGPLTTATDTMGGSTMSRTTGSPVFSATAPGQGSASTLAANFATLGRLDSASGALWGTAQDNFGMEVWVRPAVASGNQSILVNGYSAGVQGIYQVGGEYQMMLDGVLYDFNAAITGVGTWDHVAMVRDQGVATLYVNGVAAGTTAAAVSGTPNFHSFLGTASPGYPAGGGDFSGMMDTVRYFTFSAGQFLASDLDNPGTGPTPPYDGTVVIFK